MLALVLTAGACGADTDMTREGEGAMIRAADPLALAAPGPVIEYPMSKYGGSGGSPVSPLNTAMIVGLQLNTGRLVDRLNVYWYGASEDNTRQVDQPIRDLNFLSQIGGDGGGTNYTQWCPENFVAVGIQGRAGDQVDALGLICGNLDNTDETYATAVYGGTGGKPFHSVCAPGFAMTGLDLRSGSLVDSIRGICHRLK